MGPGLLQKAIKDAERGIAQSNDALGLALSELDVETLELCPPHYLGFSRMGREDSIWDSVLCHEATK